MAQFSVFLPNFSAKGNQYCGKTAGKNALHYFGDFNEERWVAFLRENIEAAAMDVYVKSV